MKCRYLRAHNYCQFRRLDLPLFGNNIGIVGPNGVGKSTLLNILSDTVTGEFSKKKDELITAGESSGSIEVELWIDSNLSITIYRELHRNRARITYSDGREATEGVDAVNQVIYDLLADKAVLQNIVFPKQSEIANLLFSNAGRERLSQRFFGVEQATAIEKAVASRLNRIHFYDVSNLKSVEERKASLEKEITEIESFLEKNFPSTVEQELKQLEGEADKIQQLQVQVTTYNNLTAAIKDLSQKVENLEREVNETQTAVQSVDQAQLKARIERLKKAQEDRPKRKKLENELEELMTRLQNLGPIPHSAQTISQKEEQLEALQADYSLATSAAKHSHQLNKDIQSNGAAYCNICGAYHKNQIKITPFPENNRIIYEKRISELKIELRDFRIQNQFHERSQTQLQDKIDAKTESLRDLGPELKEGGDPEKLEKAFQLYTQLVNTLQTQETELKSTQKLLQESRDRLLKFKNQSDQTVDLEKLSQVQERLKDLKKLEVQAREEKTSLREKRATLIEVEKEFLRLSREAVENNRLQIWQSKLGQLHKLFAYDGAPKTLVSRRVAKMQAAINQYLSILNVPFTVEVESGFNFVCRFEKWARPFKPYELSGGQKIDLGVSFRLAACETFASHLGILTLDEPTQNVDEETIARYTEVLERLAILGRERNMQFITVTHARSLSNSFDQLVKLPL